LLKQLHENLACTWDKVMKAEIEANNLPSVNGKYTYNYKKGTKWRP